MTKSAVNTGIKPPSEFISDAKKYKFRFDLVKKNFEESYADYMMGKDLTKKNIRTYKQYDELVLVTICSNLHCWSYVSWTVNGFNN